MESVPENRRRSSEYSIVDGIECVLVRAESASCDHMLPSLHSTPPMDLTTLYTILRRLVRIAEKLDQSHILVTAECAIYSKAQHILWNKPALLDGKVTMRLGGMHLDMAYISSIRKRRWWSTEMVVFCPCWLTPMYTRHRRQDSCLKGNRCREETGV